jgi:hypothetical protein
MMRTAQRNSTTVPRRRSDRGLIRGRGRGEGSLEREGKRVTESKSCFEDAEDVEALVEALSQAATENAGKCTWSPAFHVVVNGGRLDICMRS